MNTVNLMDPETIQPSDKELLVKDNGCPSLYVRVTPSGHRAWYCQKRVGAKLYKVKIADVHIMSCQEARIECAEILRNLRAGIAPNDRKRLRKSLEIRVLDVFADYFEEYAKHHHSRPNETKQGFDRYWGKVARLAVAQLNPETIQEWLNNLKDSSGAATANKQYNQLRAVINWGLAQRKFKLTENPFVGVSTFKTVPREIYLDSEQFAKLQEALENNPGDSADAAWLAVLTGARKGTVLAMKWEDIDFENGVWVTPSKGKRIVRVPLTERSKQVLRSRRFKNDSPFVFPAESESGHVVNIQDDWDKIRKEAGLSEYHFHDLRHTALTWLGLSGTNAFTIRDIAGHANTKTTERYTHTGNTARAREEMERAQNLFARSTSLNVVDFGERLAAKTRS